jgi:hypothetical protein
LEGIEDHHPILDRIIDLRAIQSIHVETAMKKNGDNHKDTKAGETWGRSPKKDFGIRISDCGFGGIPGSSWSPNPNSEIRIPKSFLGLRPHFSRIAMESNG